MHTTLHQMSTQNGKPLNIKLEMKTDGHEQLWILREAKNKQEEK